MQQFISKDSDSLSVHAAEWIVDYIGKVLKSQDRFTLVLSGGNTPKKLYAVLASEQFNNKIDWKKIHVFWGDERHVPFDDERNNAKMAFDELLNKVPVPKAQIHKIRTDLDPETSARHYEKVLRQYFSSTNDSRLTTFDLTLLGLGDNAHTLSLFPGYQQIHEKNSWVISLYLREQNMQRISLTPPVVNLSAKILFLVSGIDKADAVSHVLLNDFTPDLYPAQLIKPDHGEVIWFMDEAAAERIKK